MPKSKEKKDIPVIKIELTKIDEERKEQIRQKNIKKNQIVPQDISEMEPEDNPR